MNDEFVNLLGTIPSNDNSAELFSAILKDSFKHRNSSVKNSLTELQKEIAKQMQRLKNGRELVLDGEITASDYKGMKTTIEESIEKLETDEAKLLDALENHGGLIDDAVEVIKTLQIRYQKGNVLVKQRIVSSIYPEKLIFENMKYRTPKTLNVISLIGRIGESFRGNKKGKNLKNLNSSLGVDPERFELSSK